MMMQVLLPKLEKSTKHFVLLSVDSFSREREEKKRKLGYGLLILHLQQMGVQKGLALIC